MTKVYQILKLTKKGHLIMWDGPTLDKKSAKATLAKRQKENPDKTFFILKQDSFYVKSQ